MRVTRFSYEIRTHGPMKYYGIRELVEEAVRESGYVNGLVHIHAVGATPFLLIASRRDVDALNRLLIRLVPVTGWRHGNAYAHLRSSLMGTHLVVPFIDRKLWMNEDQEIYFVETRPVHNHRRIIHLIIHGE